MSIRISQRAQQIEPFYVMEVAKAASMVEESLASHSDAKRMIRLNIGEPDFTAAPLVQELAMKAIQDANTQYTHATGLLSLRERISDWYKSRFALNISPERIIITAGASGALQLACLALIEPGDEILMPDPSYPCNRQFVQASGGVAKLIPTSAESRFQLSLEQVQAHWGAKTKGVLLASPSNPTGTSIEPEVLKDIIEFVHSKGGICIADEIYLGLSYEQRFSKSALSHSDQVVSINSFSKYFNMTGWRLGWMVAPLELCGAVERLAQNLFICPSTISQHAALGCFERESLALFEQRRAEFKARRDAFVPELQRIGLRVPVMPDGAFYAWADCSQVCQKLGVASSWELAFEFLHKAHVAVAPGRDFGQNESAKYIRFSTASSSTELELAIKRLAELIGEPR
jgi:aspartate/methionine/tyrosine aminotransferase